MRRRDVLTSLAGAMVTGLATGPGLAGGKKPARVTTKRKTGGRGKDPNVKRDGDINKRGAAKIAAPRTKGGPRAKGVVGTVHVDNRTELYIRVYLDGDYRGTVGPFGDLHRDVIAGDMLLYARAVYDDGTYDYWGPTTAYVAPNGTFTWLLHEG